MPDFGDLVAQGIMEGFAGISPMIEKRQQLAMLQEDRAYQRILGEEHRAYAKLQNEREQKQFEQNLQTQRLTQTELGQRIRQQSELFPLQKDRELAAIESSRAQTAISRESLQRSREFRAAREALVKQLRGVTTKDKDLDTYLTGLASNPNYSGDEIITMLEGKVREKAAPDLIAKVKNGEIEGLDPAFATVLEMGYASNGKVNLDELPKYLTNTNAIVKSMLVESVGEAIKAGYSLPGGEFGLADATDMILGLGSMLKELDRQTRQKSPTQPIELTPETMPNLTPGDVIKSGQSAGALLDPKKSGWSKDKIDTYMWMKSATREAQSIAVDQSEPLQLITADALSDRPLGAFSAMFASLAPGVGEGEPEDRVANMLTGEKGKLAGAEQTKVAQEAVKALGAIDGNQFYSRQAIEQKLAEFYIKLRRAGEVGVQQREEAMLKAFLNWLKEGERRQREDRNIIGARRPVSTTKMSDEPVASISQFGRGDQPAR